MVSVYMDFVNYVDYEQLSNGVEEGVEEEWGNGANKEKINVITIQDPVQLLAFVDKTPGLYNNNELSYIIDQLTTSGKFLDKLIRNEHDDYNEYSSLATRVFTKVFVTYIGKFKVVDIQKIKRCFTRHHLGYNGSYNAHFISTIKQKTYASAHIIVNKDVAKELESLRKSMDDYVFIAKHRRSIKIKNNVHQILYPQKDIAINECMRKGNYQDVMEILFDKYPDHDVTCDNFCKIIPNTRLKWTDADQLYDIFKQRSFRPDISCFDAMMQYVSHTAEKYCSLFQKVVSDLISENPENSLEIFRKVHGTGKNVYLLDIFKCIWSNGFPLQLFHKLLELDDWDNESYLEMLYANVKLDSPFTSVTLGLACKKGYETFVEDILQKGDVVPDMECLYFACSSKNINENIIEILCSHKLFVDKQCFKNALENYLMEFCRQSTFSRISKLFIQCGLKVADEILEMALDKGFYFDDIEYVWDGSKECLKRICDKYCTYPAKYLDYIAKK